MKLRFIILQVCLLGFSVVGFSMDDGEKKSNHSNESPGCFPARIQRKNSFSFDRLFEQEKKAKDNFARKAEKKLGNIISDAGEREVNL